MPIAARYPACMLVRSQTLMTAWFSGPLGAL